MCYLTIARAATPGLLRRSVAFQLHLFVTCMFTEKQYKEELKEGKVGRGIPFFRATPFFGNALGA